MHTDILKQFAAKVFHSSDDTSKAISINLRLRLRSPQGENMFTNMAFFGCVFLSDVELYMFSLYKHAEFRLSADVKQTL